MNREVLPSMEEVMNFVNALDIELMNVREKYKQLYCKGSYYIHVTKILSDVGMKAQLPFRCLETSLLVFAWLLYNSYKDIKLIYGCHDDLKDKTYVHLHCWIECNEKIIDYTEIQFEVLKNQKNDNEKIPITFKKLNNNYNLKNTQYIFEKTDSRYSNPYILSYIINKDIFSDWRKITEEIILVSNERKINDFKNFSDIYIHIILLFLEKNNCTFSEIFDHRKCKNLWERKYR